MKKSIVLIFTLCLAFGICGCSSATVSDTQTTDTPAGEEKAFAIGEEIFINNDEGEYKFKITGVEETAKAQL